MAAGCGTANSGTDMGMGDMRPAHCSNGIKDADESDIDCGGSCAPCADSKMCQHGPDCTSGVCTNASCSSPSCSDGVKNGFETDIDCGGGLCSGCADGKMCKLSGDCVSKTCTNNTCAMSQCSDGMKDGNETDVDCGGGDCAPCADGKMCLMGPDCAGGTCANNLCTGGGGADMLVADMSIACVAPMANCDGNQMSGCNIDLNTDPKNCGKCAHSCSMNLPMCVNGNCAAKPAGKIVFTTSAVYNGNLGGLAGADQNCKTVANNAGLQGTFMAWLSDSNTTAGARLSHSNVPYVLTDGTVVANDWAGLTSGTLLHAISLTESGKAPPASTGPCGNDFLWSNTKEDGTYGRNACNDWTSTDPNGAASWGKGDITNMGWSYACVSSNTGNDCNSQAPLYCIQQ